MADGDELLKIKTRNYRPVITGGAASVWGASQAQGFALNQVEAMRKDAQVSLCLSFRGTPISSGEVEVTANAPEVKSFVERQYKRMWRRSLPAALEALPYGFSAAEILYRRRRKMYHFDDLKMVSPRDAQMWSRKGKRALVRVSNGLGGTGGGLKGRMASEDAGEDGRGEYDLPCRIKNRPAKGWWWAPDTLWDRWYGRSVLPGAWLPWRLKTLPGGGGMDALAKWFYRHAYRGYTIRYPDQVFQDDPGQPAIDAHALARQMIESLKTGADIALSNARDPATGEYIWQIESYGEVNGAAADMIEYVRGFLDVQIQRGINIPDGIVTDGGGQGYAGRKIPEDAYYVAAEHSFWSLVETFDEEVTRPLTLLNYGREAKYKVEPKPLLPQRQQTADGDPIAAMMGGGQEGQDTGPAGTPQLSMAVRAKSWAARMASALAGLSKEAAARMRREVAGLIRMARRKERAT